MNSKKGVIAMDEALYSYWKSKNRTIRLRETHQIEKVNTLAGLLGYTFSLVRNYIFNPLKTYKALRGL